MILIGFFARWALSIGIWIGLDWLGSGNSFDKFDLVLTMILAAFLSLSAQIDGIKALGRAAVREARDA